MSKELHLFALWSLAILTAAVAVILYQHATHTNVIASLIGGLSQGKSNTAFDPANTISANPTFYGAASRASGIWTPLGPQGATVMKGLPSASYLH